MSTVRHCVALSILACGVCDVSSAERQHSYGDSASICVPVTTIDSLSGPAAMMMREEATRIWLRHGVALTWGNQALRNCDAVAPLVFDDTQVRKFDGGRRDRALARTIFFGRRQVMYVSAPQVFALLSAFAHSEGERDVYGGRALGRVVAHELGHLLLTTMSHSATGLMRPFLDVREIYSLDDQVTAISDADASRLASRFALALAGPLVPRSVPIGPVLGSSIPITLFENETDGGRRPHSSQLDHQSSD